MDPTAEQKLLDALLELDSNPQEQAALLTALGEAKSRLETELARLGIRAVH